MRLRPEPLFLREACDQSEWPKVIASLLDQAGGAGAQVHVVLNPSLVTQLQIEKPAVPDNEMAGALPWAIKDLVSEPVNQLICDYVDMPFNPTAKPRATVVCLLRSRVQAIADCINEKAHLLDITTEEEFALVDLIGRSADGTTALSPAGTGTLLDGGERGAALLQSSTTRLCH